MTSEELYTLGVVGCFIATILLYCLMALLLYLNDRPINILFGLSFLREYFRLISSKKSKLIYASVPILYFVSFLLIPYFFNKTLPSGEERNCNYKKSFLNWKISELITSKYIDKRNHATMSLWVMHTDSSSNNFPLNYHFEEVYENAQAGDSIIKKRNSQTVTLVRNGEQLNFHIDVGCN